jgi:hypothetical protein
MMATHDQETYEFFKGSAVKCVLCPRQGGTEDSYVQSMVRGNTFTHHQVRMRVRACGGGGGACGRVPCRMCGHTVFGARSPPHHMRAQHAHIARPHARAPQKTVVVDAPLHAAAAGAGGALPVSTAPAQQQQQQHEADGLARTASRRLARTKSTAAAKAPAAPTRRLLAFVGGLDLTSGRYDTHDHPLFATTQPGGPHEHDCYQPCIDGACCVCVCVFCECVCVPVSGQARCAATRTADAASCLRAHARSQTRAQACPCLPPACPRPQRQPAAPA